MIDRPAFVSAAKKLLIALENDLRARAQDDPFAGRFRAEYDEAREKERTAASYDAWLDERLTQIGAAWILAGVFLRFLEDNGFLKEVRLAGPGEKLQQAGEHRDAYFRAHPSHSDREFLESLFRELSRLPGMKELLDEETNPLWQLGPSADGARALVEFFRAIDPDSGAVRWAFDHEEADTRFLGDLYQDLSESARKRYALLQTPDFVEEFILDRTLEPAIEEFGLERTSLIDPTCGSGHFLLGAFARLDRRWEEEGSLPTPAARVQRVLDSIAGVDINPFAVAIARFRLLLAALRAAGCTTLSDAPDFKFHLAAGDSLLEGPRPDDHQGLLQTSFADDALAGRFQVEQKGELASILGRSYAAVVGNPPYITPKDKALNKAYRARFGSCHMKYALSVPFMERFMDLATPQGEGRPGFVGKITSNSFMKREFGKNLIVDHFKRWDLTHVIDTSGAYIPGHGTPTVILFARARKPVAPTVRAVLGIRGEPTTPDEPAAGLVWRSIVTQVDRPGTEDNFVSVDDTDRERFHEHPWSLSGGGASELKSLIEAASDRLLGSVTESIGFMAITAEDDAYVLPSRHLARDLPNRLFAVGDTVRDWVCDPDDICVFPYAETGGTPPLDLKLHHALGTYLWPLRTTLRSRTMFGKTAEEHGGTWFTFLQFIRPRIESRLLIAFAEVATHNHFVLDRGGKVFKQTAPVIKLPHEATEDDYYALLGLLNSSTACFWMKQVFYPKASSTGDVSKDKGRPEANRYQLSGAQLGKFPLPSRPLESITSIARSIDECAICLSSLEPRVIIDKSPSISSLNFEELEQQYRKLQARMVFLQEEIDWEAYWLYGLIANEGLRGADLDNQHGIGADARPAFWTQGEPNPGVPSEVTKTYRERRRAIEESHDLSIVESPIHKRLWLGRQGVFGHAKGSYGDRVHDAFKGYLLNQLEQFALWADHRLIAAPALAERLRDDADFMQVAALYRKRDDFDLPKLVSELVESEGVPYLTALRYKDPGLRKRAAWEETWALQRAEDDAEARGVPFETKIPVPPKYKSTDFLKQSYWSHRGKLDVPKERFILYPGAQRKGEDGPLLGWAGWDEKERCIALYSWLGDRREMDGWGKDELTPLLAGILELLPWLKQWHDEPEPGEAEGFGAQIERIFDEDVRSLGLTRDDLLAWRPPKATRARRKKKA